MFPETQGTTARLPMTYLKSSNIISAACDCPKVSHGEFKKRGLLKDVDVGGGDSFRGTFEGQPPPV